MHYINNLLYSQNENSIVSVLKTQQRRKKVFADILKEESITLFQPKQLARDLYSLCQAGNIIQ